MRSTETQKRRMNWAGLPLLAMLARLLTKELTLQNEFLLTENKILKSKIKGRIQFTDKERRTLVDAAMATPHDPKELLENAKLKGEAHEFGRSLVG